MGECRIAFLGYFCARHVRAQPPHGAAVKYINVPDVLIQESIVNMHVYEQLVSVEGHIRTAWPKATARGRLRAEAKTTSTL